MEKCANKKLSIVILKMHTGDKLRCIRNWSYSFEIAEEPNGTVYGKILLASFLSTHRYTDSKVCMDEVIEQAYQIVRRNCYEMMRFIDPGIL